MVITGPAGEDGISRPHGIIIVINKAWRFILSSIVLLLHFKINVPWTLAILRLQYKTHVFLERIVLAWDYSTLVAGVLIILMGYKLSNKKYSHTQCSLATEFTPVYCIKGAVSRDFSSSGFFWKQFCLTPIWYTEKGFRFFYLKNSWNC